MIDPRDPLAGLDPYPRELVDALGSDQERADLLEEIVSTPGPAASTPARTRALLAIGIAAALVIIGGGWFLASNHSAHDATPVAASSTTPASTAPTSVAPPASTATSPAKARSGCRRALTRSGQLKVSLARLSRAVQGRLGTRSRFYLRATRSGKRYVVVDGRGCTIRTLRSLRATGH